MNEFYELGVKLALDMLQQTSSKTRSSQTAASTKLPKIEKPKMPPKQNAPEQVLTAPPRPMPTRAPDTGPYGMQYGGRGTGIRNV